MKEQIISTFVNKMLHPNEVLELFNIIKHVLEKASAVANSVQEMFMIS